MNPPRARSLGSPYTFRPAQKSPCLCGSGEKFKRCCAARYARRSIGTKARTALEREDYLEALAECRADITQYTIWHKSHTDPLIVAGVAEDSYLLNIDIKALAGCVELLHWCYLKAGKRDEFPATLERLRLNINHPRWQRKIVYFCALHALTPAWDRDAGRTELRKLGSVLEDTDVEILQLYLDLFGSELSFVEMQQLIDRILMFAEKEVDRLHYRALKGVQFILIGDQAAGEREVDAAINDFRTSRGDGDLSTYEAYRFAMALELLGGLKADSTIVDEAIARTRSLLESKDLSITGRADMLRQLGDAYRRKAAWSEARDAYLKAFEAAPLAIAKVFLAECLLHLEGWMAAANALASVDSAALETERGEYADYVFSIAAVAVESEDPQRLQEAERLLKALDLKAPYFRESRDALLLTVIETRRSGKSSAVVQRARRALAGVALGASRYLKLEPNVMGIGVNLGRILEDLGKRGKEHALASDTRAGGKKES